jgi:hypothetical protein
MNRSDDFYNANPRLWKKEPPENMLVMTHKEHEERHGIPQNSWMLDEIAEYLRDRYDCPHVKRQSKYKIVVHKSLQKRFRLIGSLLIAAFLIGTCISTGGTDIPIRTPQMLVLLGSCLAGVIGGVLIALGEDEL